MDSSRVRRPSSGIGSASDTPHCRLKSERSRPATSRRTMWFERLPVLLAGGRAAVRSPCRSSKRARWRARRQRPLSRRVWPTPSRQVAGVLTFGQYERPFERAGEILLDLTALHAPAQKVRPKEFAERRDVLGEAAGPAQLTGQTAKRIIREIDDGARDIFEFATAALSIVWMHPGVVIEHDPECIRLQRTQIRDHADEHVLEAFLVKGQGKVMMVDDVVSL